MKTLETRTVRAGLTRRRYALPDGRRMTTYELPATVLRRLGMRRTYQILDTWERGEATRARQALIRARLADNIKPAAIAHEVGVTARHIQRMRQKGNTA